MTQFRYGTVADLSEGEVIGIMVSIDTYEPLIIMLPGDESREQDISMWTEMAKELGVPKRHLEEYYKAYIRSGYTISFNTGEATSSQKLAEKLVADALKKKASKQKRKSKRGRMAKKEITMTNSQVKEDFIPEPKHLEISFPKEKLPTKPKAKKSK